MRLWPTWLTAGVIIGATLPVNGLELLTKWGIFIRAISPNSVSNLLETLDLYESEQLPSVAVLAATEPTRSYYMPSTRFLLDVAAVLEKSPLSRFPAIIDAILPLEHLQRSKHGVAWVKDTLHDRHIPFVLGKKHFIPRLYVMVDEGNKLDELSLTSQLHPPPSKSLRTPPATSQLRARKHAPVSILSYFLEKTQRSKMQSVHWCKHLSVGDIFGEPRLELWQLLDLPCLERLEPDEGRAMAQAYTDLATSLASEEISDWFLFRAALAEFIHPPRTTASRGRRTQRSRRKGRQRQHTITTLVNEEKFQGLSKNAQTIIDFFVILNSPYCQGLVSDHLPRLLAIKDQIPPALHSSFEFELLALMTYAEPLIIDTLEMYLSSIRKRLLHLFTVYDPEMVPPYIVRTTLKRLLPHEEFLALVRGDLFPSCWLQAYLAQTTGNGHFPALFLGGPAMDQMWRSQHVDLMEDRARGRILNGLERSKNGPGRPVVYSNELDSLGQCTADVHIRGSTEILLRIPGDLVRISDDQNLRFLCDGSAKSEKEILHFFGGRLMALALNGTPLPSLAKDLVQYLFGEDAKPRTLQDTLRSSVNGRLKGGGTRKKPSPKLVAATCFNSVEKKRRREVSHLLRALASLLRIWNVPRCLFPGEEYN